MSLSQIQWSLLTLWCSSSKFKVSVLYLLQNWLSKTHSYVLHGMFYFERYCTLFDAKFLRCFFEHLVKNSKTIFHKFAPFFTFCLDKCLHFLSFFSIVGLQSWFNDCQSWSFDEEISKETLNLKGQKNPCLNICVSRNNRFLKLDANLRKHCHTDGVNIMNPKSCLPSPFSKKYCYTNFLRMP